MGSNITLNSGSPVPTYTYSLTNFGASISNPYVFPVGITTVYVKASNVCGDDIESFDVTVSDNQPPVLTPAPNQDVNLDANCSITVPNVTGTATDNCLGTTITQRP